MKKATHSIWILMTWLCLSISGCTSEEELWVQQLTSRVMDAEYTVSQLKNHINKGLVKNAVLLKRYADVAKNDKTELTEIFDALALDATTNGPLYKGLKTRLDEASTLSKAAPKKGQFAVASVEEELLLITEAAKPAIYNMMLTDPINVIADMSDGKLARVEAMSKEASIQASGASDTGAGSQLIGNPSYGRWSTGSGGTSFWAWYGMYSMFGHLYSRPIYYSSWGSGRHYSYYNDYGRSHYTSPSQFKSQTKVENTAKSKFKKSGKSFTSPYAKTRTGASRTVVKPKASISSYKSSYASQSTARNTSTRTSRSGSRGK
ncbi:MAG: hypothetical protein O7D86_12335 [Proteobacteria bacterium]|nr:hypothetical protein [Pseudomonadota bacterium]